VHAYAAARGECMDALNDDLNTPQLVGLLNRFGSHRLWTEFDAVLGLSFAERAVDREEQLPEDVLELVARRNEARKARNWSESDRLRDQLVSMGYEVGDGPTGTTVKRRAI